MRRQYFNWTWLVLALVLTVYGGYSLIYSHINNNPVPTLGLVFLIIGSVLLVAFLIFAFISLFQKKKKIDESNTVIENSVKEIKEESVEVVEEPAEIKEEPKNTYSPRSEITYENRRVVRSFSGGSGYVKRIGHGPVLRISEEEILDMRSNTYYRIEGNMVNRSGSGPVYEISGNRIREAFGSYLFELSGSNLNKIYGGFYASISGGFLKVHDLSEQYEIPTSLNKKQILVIAALLFGNN